MSFMDRVSRNNANQNNSEILNDYNWDIEIIKWPAAVYYPGDQIFSGRLKSCGSMPDYSHTLGSIEVVGGFKNIQPGDVDHNNATIQLEFTDYADSSIGYLVKDWMDKIDNPSTRVSLPKSLLVLDCKIYQLNSLRQKIKEWTLLTGLPTSANTNENFGNKRNTNGQVSLSIEFEWWDLKYLNTLNVLGNA